MKKKDNPYKKGSISWKIWDLVFKQKKYQQQYFYPLLKITKPTFISRMKSGKWKPDDITILKREHIIS